MSSENAPKCRIALTHCQYNPFSFIDLGHFLAYKSTESPIERPSAKPYAGTTNESQALKSSGHPALRDRLKRLNTNETTHNTLRGPFIPRYCVW